MLWHKKQNKTKQKTPPQKKQKKPHKKDTLEILVIMCKNTTYQA